MGKYKRLLVYHNGKTRVCGAINSSYDARDYKINASHIDTFPETFTTRKIPVKDQQTTGSCVAHALSTVVEFHHGNVTNSKKQFSTEFIYGYRELGYYIGQGMSIRNALNTVKKYGVPYMTDCRGNNEFMDAMDHIRSNIDTYLDLAYPHRISGYAKLRSINEMKTAIMNNGPIIVSMKWYTRYDVDDDIYSYDPSSDYGLHCVMIYGWNTEGWLVQNSWGTNFANGGRFIIPFEFNFNEAWCIIDNIDDTKLPVIKPYNNPVMKFTYKVFNKVVNSILHIIKILH